ncbi:MAG TPA: regulatory protein RecX [Magnetospirillaceae bacterium]|nr:regulatory protein RecX [Magnetospirillaceae bacterium]
MRVESLKIGASGIVRLRMDGGSAFSFRQDHLPPGLGSLPDEGGEAGSEILAAVQAASAIHLAELLALRLLARSEQTRWLLTLKLRGRGFTDEAASPALDRLERLGILSDERYARAWASQRARLRGDGPGRVAAGLAARGVEEVLARRICGEVFSGSERALALMQAVRRLRRSGRNSVKAAERRLRAEGWRSFEVRAALDSFRDERD